MDEAGRIVIKTEIDDSDAQKQLNRLQKRISDIKAELEANTKKRDMYMERMDKITGIRESSGLALAGGKEYREAEEAVLKLNTQIAEQRIELQKAEEEAGRYASRLVQAQAPAEASTESIEKTAEASENVAQETDKASRTMERLEKAGTDAAEKVTKGFGSVTSGIKKLGKKQVFIFPKQKVI